MGLGPELQAISNGDAVNADKVYGNDQSLREFMTSIPVENLSKPTALSTLTFTLEGEKTVATASPSRQVVYCFGDQKAGLSTATTTNLLYVIASGEMITTAGSGSQTVTISLEKCSNKSFTVGVTNIITLSFDVYPATTPLPYVVALSEQELLPSVGVATNKLVQDAVISSAGTITSGHYVRAKMVVTNANTGVDIKVSNVQVVVTAKTMHQE